MESDSGKLQNPVVVGFAARPKRKRIWILTAVVVLLAVLAWLWLISQQESPPLVVREVPFITESGSGETCGVFSPDGGGPSEEDNARPGRYDSTGAYLHYARQGDKYSLWRQPASGGQAEKVLDGMENSTFALSSKGIYFIARGSEDKFWKIMIVFHEFSTGKRTKIVDLRWGTSSGTGYSFSPDGRFLLYTQSDRETDDLMLVENFR